MIALHAAAERARLLAHLRCLNIHAAIIQGVAGAGELLDDAIRAWADAIETETRLAAALRMSRYRAMRRVS